jgi:hypothetical protein
VALDPRVVGVPSTKGTLSSHESAEA